MLRNVSLIKWKTFNTLAFSLFLHYSVYVQSLHTILFVHLGLYLHTAPFVCSYPHILTQFSFYQDPRIFWLVTGFMFLGSGMIWRRLLSFLGRHLEPSVPPLVILSHTHTTDESGFERFWIKYFFSPVCDTDPSSLEEKSQSIRLQNRSPMMFCATDILRTAALRTIVLSPWTSWTLCKAALSFL